MQQFLHVFIVDRRRRKALVHPSGAGWLLPILICPERGRNDGAVLRLAEAHGVNGEIIGQWLGRAAESADAIDWLAVVDSIAIEPSVSTKDLRWTSLDSLTSSDAVLDYQQWAVSEALATDTLPSVPGPFGSLCWLDNVRSWVEEVVGTVGQVASYRSSAYEVVLGFSGRHRVFVKGLWCDRAREADVTMALAETAPDSFARTLALRSGRGGAVWWLTDGCPGVSLAQDPTLRNAIRVVEACARLQQRLGSARFVDLPTLDLAAAADWAKGVLQENHAGNAGYCCARIERAFQDVGDTAARFWVPLDLDPGNVLLDGDAVRFIDLDDSYSGPAPLAAATLVRRIARSLPSLADAVASGALRDAYLKAWWLPRRPRARWTMVELASRILEDYLGWQRLVKMSERGEVHGLLDVARRRIAHRLTRAAMRADPVS